MTMTTNQNENDLYLCLDFLGNNVDMIGDSDLTDIILTLSSELYERGYLVEDLISEIGDIWR